MVPFIRTSRKENSVYVNPKKGVTIRIHQLYNTTESDVRRPKYILGAHFGHSN